MTKLKNFRTYLIWLRIAELILKTEKPQLILSQ